MSNFSTEFIKARKRWWFNLRSEVTCEIVGCAMLLPVCAREQSEQSLSVLGLDVLTGRESLQGGVQSRGVQRGDPGWV